MKFTKVSQLVLASVLGLGVASLLTACQITTVNYVYVANNGSVDNTNGEISVYAMDSESGALRAGGKAVSSGGVNPVSLASTTDFANLYVANAGSNNVVHFDATTNGLLTVKDKLALPGVPVAIAVGPSNNLLFVITGTTSANLSIYKLSSGALGSLVAQVPLTLAAYPADTMVPTALTVLPNGKAVYVTVYDQSAYNPVGTVTSTANPGWIFGFDLDSNGNPTPTSGSPWKAGVKPSGIAADPTDRFVYATDYASNQLIAYSISSHTHLYYLINGPFKTGNEPSAITIDPRGKFIYITNSLDSSVSAYDIDLSTGTPSTAVSAAGSANNKTDTQPVAVAVDTAEGRYVYTGNFLGNSVSGFKLDPTTGTLVQTQATPYPTGAGPTALLIVPHGNHATQWVETN